MPVIECDIQVRWRHQVHFTEDVFSPENPVLRDVLSAGRAGRPTSTLVIADEMLAQARPDLLPSISAYFATHAAAIRMVCPPVSIVGGEAVKNAYFRVSEIHALIDRFHIDRHNYVIAIGGGALLDMVGLAASTAHRGVRHVRIPTTTLAQDDSGVGVKNGINAFGKKNFIGTFSPPFAVINDFNLLATLSERDKRAGYVEAVKVACIRDRAFFEWIESQASALARFEAAAMKPLIFRSAELHLNHIATGGDPFEMGSARPLDFGHWAAHKLEQISKFTVAHGEAVAIGMAVDLVYSRMQGILDEATCERVLKLIESIGFATTSPYLMTTGRSGEPAILEGLEEFREHLGGELTVTLVPEIGTKVEVHEMNRVKILNAVVELQKRAVVVEE